MSAAPQYERILAREGLAPLDFDDGAGGIKVGNRGSGKLLDGERAFARAGATDELAQRRAILESHFFLRGERRIYAMWARGMSTREIARQTGKGRMSVFRFIVRIERDHREVQQYRLRDLLEECDAATLVMVFALLERALEAPDDIRELIGRARMMPQIRAILEPDEVRDDG